MVEEWPFFRRTVRNPGSTPDPGPRRSPTLQWRHDAHARIFGTPLVSGGTVYVGTCAQSHWAGCLVAIARESGDRAWMAAEQAMEVRGTPGLHDGKLYVDDLDDRGYILDSSDGELLHLEDNRSLTPPDGVSPLVHDGTVFTTPVRLEARDADSWALRWTRGGEESNLHVEEPPAISDGSAVAACLTTTGERVYAGQEDGYPVYVTEVEPSVTVVDPAPGSVRWTRSLPGRARAPAIHEGVAYLATWGSEPQGKRYTAVKPMTDEQPVPDEEPADYSEFGTVHAIDVETGEEYWSHRIDEPAKTNPAVFEDTVCVGTLGGTVIAFDASTGDRRWETRVNDAGGVLPWPTIAAETVYVGSRDGWLYALDRHDGTVRWRFETDSAVDSNPSVLDGIVYVGDTQGTVYAIGGE